MRVNGYGVSCWGDENVLKLVVVRIAQLLSILKIIELYTLNG